MSIKAPETPPEYRDETSSPRCPDCGNPAGDPRIDEGWCVLCAQPVESHPTGKPPEFRTRTENRFWSKVDVRDPDQCWPWTRSIGRAYGQFRMGDKIKKAHRVAYTLYHRLDSLDDIPGEVLHHECTNKICCNPRHLRPTTYSGNIKESYRNEGRNAPNRKISDQERREIKFKYENTDVTQAELADEYGVAASTINRAVNS